MTLTDERPATTGETTPIARSSGAAVHDWLDGAPLFEALGSAGQTYGGPAACEFIVIVRYDEEGIDVLTESSVSDDVIREMIGYAAERVGLLLSEAIPWTTS